VLCADTRGTHGLVTSDDTDKFRVIGNNDVSVLIAGEVTKANELVNQCEVAIKAELSSRTDPLNMDLYTTGLLRLLRGAVHKRKSELINEHLLLRALNRRHLKKPRIEHGALENSLAPRPDGPG
jgi:20S proteasome alpha/beta subunit